MQFKPLVEKEPGQPIIIAGPCSAETEEQVLATAHALKDQKIDFFRESLDREHPFTNSMPQLSMEMSEAISWIGTGLLCSPNAC